MHEQMCTNLITWAARLQSPTRPRVPTRVCWPCPWPEHLTSSNHLGLRSILADNPSAVCRGFQGIAGDWGGGGGVPGTPMAGATAGFPSTQFPNQNQVSQTPRGAQQSELFTKCTSPGEKHVDRIRERASRVTVALTKPSCAHLQLPERCEREPAIRTEICHSPPLCSSPTQISNNPGLS